MFLCMVNGYFYGQIKRLGPNHFKPYGIFLAAELKSISVVQPILSIKIAQAPPCGHAYKLRSVALNGYVIVFNPIGE